MSKGYPRPMLVSKPSYFSPSKYHKHPILKDYSHFFYELKLDGDRMMCYNGRVYNRRLHPQELNFPEITMALLKSGCWCDGEIAVDDGKDFNAFQNWRHYPHRIVYYVFHIFKGKLPNHPQIKRVLRANNGVGLFKYAQDSGYEGIVAKENGYKYEFGVRSPQWVKFKCFKREVVRVTSYETNKDGITFNSPLRVSCNGNKHIAVKKLFDTQGYLDIEIQYLEKTKNNKYRQPTYVRVV